MIVKIEPGREEWKALCDRPSRMDESVSRIVDSIISRVREGGDAAVKAVTAEIDGRAPESLRVSDERITAACAKVDEDLKKAISDAAANIRAFHEAEVPAPVEVETAPGVRCIQKPVPIEKVGLYIPGGTAPLFSTVLMLAIPAKIAGCREIVLCTPAGKDGEIAPAVLYTASFCGVTKIFEIGGAQAVAAMAFGTESVPKVDKIFGPGNRFVTTAKQMVGADAVAIDMPAGPSEVMVIADGDSNPAYVAADLLSQAEHGRDSQVILVSKSASFADEVEAETLRQAALLPRADFVGSALSKSVFVVFENDRDVIDFANTYAPEHLIVSTSDPWSIVDGITAAGSVFVGRYTPESAGDYASGTNHTLPTCAWARSYSGVNMDSFIRKMTIQEITKEGLEGLSGTIVRMAEAEGLDAHANAVKIRMKDGR